MAQSRVQADEREQIQTCGVRPPPAFLQEVSALGSIPLTRREEGQTMTEYAVVLAVITPALILVFATMADAIVARLQTVAAFLT
jgi:Flp pilus assembly pilin Flp